MFTSFGLDGLAHAAEAILGESAGRRDRAGFRRGMRAVLGWSFAVGAANSVVYLAAGSAIIALLTSLPEVRAQAEAWLLWPALMPLISVWAYCYDGVYLAATRTRPMRNIVLLAFAVFLRRAIRSRAALRQCRVVGRSGDLSRAARIAAVVVGVAGGWRDLMRLECWVDLSFRMISS
jgi:hypothetical protein